MSRIIKNEKAMVSLGGVWVPEHQALIFSIFTGATSRYSTLSRNGASYQVPTGYKLQLLAIAGAPFTANMMNINTYYGDTSVSDSASAPTNSVLIGNSTVITENTIGKYTEKPTFGEVPAGKYPCIFTASAYGFVTVLGKLVKV